MRHPSTPGDRQRYALAIRGSNPRADPADRLGLWMTVLLRAFHRLLAFRDRAEVPLADSPVRLSRSSSRVTRVVIHGSVPGP